MSKERCSCQMQNLPQNLFVIFFFTMILSNFNKRTLVKEQVFVLLGIYHVSLHNGNIIQYGHQYRDASHVLY